MGGRQALRGDMQVRLPRRNLASPRGGTLDLVVLMQDYPVDGLAMISDRPSGDGGGSAVRPRPEGCAAEFPPLLRWMSRGACLASPNGPLAHSTSIVGSPAAPNSAVSNASILLCWGIMPEPAGSGGTRRQRETPGGSSQGGGDGARSRGRPMRLQLLCEPAGRRDWLLLGWARRRVQQTRCQSSNRAPVLAAQFPLALELRLVVR